MVGPAFWFPFPPIHIRSPPFAASHHPSHLNTFCTTVKARLVIVAGPASSLHPIPFAQVYSPPQIPTVLSDPLTDPHKISLSLSHIRYSIHSLIGPACHCGRSRLLHSFHSLTYSLLPLTEPHRSFLYHPLPSPWPGSPLWLVPSCPFRFTPFLLPHLIRPDLPT